MKHDETNKYIFDGSSTIKFGVERVSQALLLVDSFIYIYIYIFSENKVLNIVHVELRNS